MKVKRIFITALVILVAYVLQCTVFPVLDIAGIKPNLLLIVTASFGFMRGSKSGMLVGFLSGLLIDIQFGKMIGFYALIYLVVGFLNGLFEQKCEEIYSDSIKEVTDRYKKQGKFNIFVIEHLLKQRFSFYLLFKPDHRS